MSTPEFLLQPVTSPSELASLAIVEAAAMLPQPFNSCYFLSTTSAEQQVTYFEFELERKWAARRRTGTRFLKAVDVRSGEVEGFVLWSLNGREMERETDAEEEVPVEVQAGHKGLLGPDAEAMAESAYAVHRRITKRFVDVGEPWIYVNKVYVRPQSQRQGIATALWREGPLKEAEAGLLQLGSETDGELRAPLPMLTVSVGVSRLFYQSVGFLAVDRNILALDDIAGKGAGYGDFWFTGLVRERKKADYQALR